MAPTTGVTEAQQLDIAGRLPRLCPNQYDQFPADWLKQELKNRGMGIPLPYSDTVAREMLVLNDQLRKNNQGAFEGRNPVLDLVLISMPLTYVISYFVLFVVYPWIYNEMYSWVRAFGHKFLMSDTCSIVHGNMAGPLGLVSWLCVIWIVIYMAFLWSWEQVRGNSLVLWPTRIPVSEQPPAEEPRLQTQMSITNEAASHDQEQDRDSSRLSQPASLENDARSSSPSNPASIFSSPTASTILTAQTADTCFNPYLPPIDSAGNFRAGSSGERIDASVTVTSERQIQELRDTLHHKDAEMQRNEKANAQHQAQADDIKANQIVTLRESLNQKDIENRLLREQLEQERARHEHARRIAYNSRGGFYTALVVRGLGDYLDWIKYTPGNRGIIYRSPDNAPNSQTVRPATITFADGNIKSITHDLSTLLIGDMIGGGKAKRGIFVLNGPTGGGKSYLGYRAPEDSIAEQVCKTIFQTSGAKVRISAGEVRENHCQDLGSPVCKGQERPQSKDDLDDLTWYVCETAASAHEKLLQLVAKACREATKINDHSSRSHTLLTISFRLPDRDWQYIHIFDLAGREDSSCTTGKQQERQRIANDTSRWDFHEALLYVADPKKHLRGKNPRNALGKLFAKIRADVPLVNYIVCVDCENVYGGDRSGKGANWRPAALELDLLRRLTQND